MLRPHRLYLPILALLFSAASALAEPPSGDYAITISDPEIFLPTGVPEGTCAALEGIDVCIDLFVTGPNSTGSGDVGSLLLVHSEGDVTGNLTGGLFGTIGGPVAKPRARLRMLFTGGISFGGVSLAARSGGRFRCAVDGSIEALRCRGRLLLCGAEGSGRLIGCESERFEFTLEQQGGPWQIRLADLATDEKGTVSGTAEVELAAGIVLGGAPAPLVVSYEVAGKYNPRRDTTSLKLVGVSDRAAKSRLKLSNLTLEAGTATGGKVVFRIAGETGKAQLVAPPAALAGATP